VLEKSFAHTSTISNVTDANKFTISIPASATIGTYDSWNVIVRDESDTSTPKYAERRRVTSSDPGLGDLYYLTLNADLSFTPAVGDVVELYPPDGLVVESGTAANLTTGSITVDSSASSVDDFYNSQVVTIVGGVGVGQSRIITDYVGSTRVATVRPAWKVTPNTSSRYAITPGNEATLVDDAITAAKIAANAVGSSEVADGAIDAAALATDAIGANELATTAIGEIQANLDTNGVSLSANGQSQVNAQADIAIADYAPLKPTVAGRTLDVAATGEAESDAIKWAGAATATDDVALKSSLAKGAEISGFNDPTAGGIADAVLDELLAGHSTAGSLSKVVSDTYDFLNGAPTFGDAMDGRGYSTALASKLDTNVDAKISEVPAKMPSLLVSSTIDDTTVTVTQTSFALTDGPPDDDALNGALVIITDAVTSEQKAVGIVKDYEQSTKTVTLFADPGVFTFADGDKVDVIASGAHQPLW
jgi:hypothetical protein